MTDLFSTILKIAAAMLGLAWILINMAEDGFNWMDIFCSIYFIIIYACIVEDIWDARSR